MAAAWPAGDDDDGAGEEAAVADEDVVAFVADAPPTIVADEFGDFRVARPGFARDFDGRGILLEAAAGVAEARPMDAGAAVELSTAAARLRVFFAMIEAADGTGFDTDRTHGDIVEVTRRLMFATEAMFAIALGGEVIGAEGGVAEVTLAHTLFAAFFTTFRTDDGVGGELPAAGTFGEAVEAVGFAATVTLIEAGADIAATFGTGDDAVITKALAGGGTDAKLRAVLLATWATSGTISTNERIGAIGKSDGIGAEVTATLARATFSALGLASETDAVGTGGAAFDMIGAGTFATGPTGDAARCAVGFATVRAGDDATVGADDFLAGGTLFDAVVAADVTVTVEGDGGGFAGTGVAGRAFNGSGIAVAADVQGRLAFAVADVDFGDGDGRLDDGVGVECDLDTQAMVFDFFGNFAFEIEFEGAPFFARGVV